MENIMNLCCLPMAYLHNAVRHNLCLLFLLTVYFAAHAENPVCQDAAAQTLSVLRAPEPRASVCKAAVSACNFIVLNSTREKEKRGHVE